MTLATGATAMIGSLRYDSHVVHARVTLALAPGVGSARVLLPAGARLEVDPGDECTLALRDEGGDDATVLTGTVAAVNRSLGGATVVAGDALAALAGIRPGATFEQQNGADVIRALAAEAGVNADVDLDVPLATYVIDQRRTALEHVALLAAWGGCTATGDNAGGLTVARFPTPPADVALRYGREIASLTVRTERRPPALIPVGSGPAGSPGAPDVLLLTTGVLPEGAPDPAPDTIREAAPVLRTPGAAETAVAGVNQMLGAPSLQAACWLVPHLRAGTVVEIADAPQPGSSGPWLLTRVVHELGPGPRASSRLWGRSLEGGGADLLAALLGALGRLL